MELVKNYVAPIILVFVLPLVLFKILYSTTPFKNIKPNKFSISTFTIILLYGFYSLKFTDKKFIGPENVDGVTPIYAANGFHFWIVSTILTCLVCNTFPNFPKRFNENFIPFLVTCNIFGLFFVLYLYFRDKNEYFEMEKDKDSSALFKFYRGLKFHPRIFGVDIKQLTNCRFGMIIWQIIILIFGFYSHYTYGFNTAILVTIILQTIYIGKFFFWETGYFNTLDITLDRAGYYICWGCLVFIPSFYTLSTYFLANNPSNLSTKACLGIFALGLVAILLNYLVDYQKEKFKANNDTNIWGKKATYLNTKYFKNGVEKDGKLLTSGFWGMSRHMNYTFEIILSLTWSLVALRLGYKPFLYVFFIILLLVHRIYRDEDKCKAKYGKYWDEYCKIVKWRLIPKIY